MRDKLILFLKQYQPLHHFARSFYWKVSSLKAQILGTKIQERKWAKRSLNEIKKGFSNLNHPHRRLILKKIGAFHPIYSILEVGCGYGPNLYLLAKEFPQADLVGIDINPLSI